MQTFGHGPPLLVIPGLQGRWQWMRPGIRVLASHFRVATYSLAGDAEEVLPLAATSFDDLVRQARNVLARAGMSRATVCGVSYGALIATRLAARYPDLVSALILASPLPPDFTPDARVRRLIGHPRLMAPTFVAGAPGRTLPEIRQARPRDWPWCAAEMLSLVARWPQSPVRMAERVRLLEDVDLVADARRVRCPTLIVTGVDGLDVIVPPAGSRRFASVIPHATTIALPHTGHFGMVTRPHVFAQVVRDFLARASDGASMDDIQVPDEEPAAVAAAGSADGTAAGASSLPWGDLT